MGRMFLFRIKNQITIPFVTWISIGYFIDIQVTNGTGCQEPGNNLTIHQVGTPLTS